MKLNTVPWRLRTASMPPVGMLVFNAQRPLLMHILHAMPDQELTALQCSVSADCFFVLAENTVLPWVPDALYVCRDPNALQLFLPTFAQLELPAELLIQALQQQLGEGSYIFNAEKNLWYRFLNVGRINRESLQELKGAIT